MLVVISCSVNAHAGVCEEAVHPLAVHVDRVRLHLAHALADCRARRLRLVVHDAVCFYYGPVQQPSLFVVVAMKEPRSVRSIVHSRV